MELFLADPREDLRIILTAFLAALTPSVNTNSLPAQSVCQTAWPDHVPHVPHPSGFGGKGCLPTPQTEILGMESACVFHLLGHHILGDVILPEQTLRVIGWSELTLGDTVAHSRDQVRSTLPLPLK